MRSTLLLVLLGFLIAACSKQPDGKGLAEDNLLDTLNDPTQTLEEGIAEELGQDAISLWTDGTYHAEVDIVSGGETEDHRSFSARLEAGAILSMKDLASGKLIEGFTPGKIDALGASEIELPNGKTYRIQLEEPFLGDSLAPK